MCLVCVYSPVGVVFVLWLCTDVSSTLLCTDIFVMANDQVTILVDNVLKKIKDPFHAQVYWAYNVNKQIFLDNWYIRDVLGHFNAGTMSYFLIPIFG